MSLNLIFQSEQKSSKIAKKTEKWICYKTYFLPPAPHKKNGDKCYLKRGLKSLCLKLSNFFWLSWHDHYFQKKKKRFLAYYVKKKIPFSTPQKNSFGMKIRLTLVCSNASACWAAAKRAFMSWMLSKSKYTRRHRRSTKPRMQALSCRHKESFFMISFPINTWKLSLVTLGCAVSLAECSTVRDRPKIARCVSVSKIRCPFPPLWLWSDLPIRPTTVKPSGPNRWMKSLSSKETNLLTKKRLMEEYREHHRLWPWLIAHKPSRKHWKPNLCPTKNKNRSTAKSHFESKNKSKPAGASWTHDGKARNLPLKEHPWLEKDESIWQDPRYKGVSSRRWQKLLEILPITAIHYHF